MSKRSESALQAIEYFSDRYGRIVYPHEIATLGDGPSIERAYLIDGSWTCAKSWTRWSEETGQWFYARVGIGAYGESTVWHG